MQQKTKEEILSTPDEELTENELKLKGFFQLVDKARVSLGDRLHDTIPIPRNCEEEE